MLIDIALEEAVYLYIVERRHRFHLKYIERVLKATAGRIDLVLFGIDFGAQRAALDSAAEFDRMFARKKKEPFELLHSFGARVSCRRLHGVL